MMKKYLLASRHSRVSGEGRGPLSLEPSAAGRRTRLFAPTRPGVPARSQTVQCGPASTRLKSINRSGRSRARRQRGSRRQASRRTAFVLCELDDIVAE